MKHIVQYSGEICSFLAARRVVEEYKKENVILLFADTNFEDKDLYRFIKETVNFLGCEFVRVADGRTPFQVYRDVNFLGNSRVAHCTKILKIKQCKDWLKANYRPDECILYLGIDWREEHRCKAIEHNWQPYKVEFPMCKEPFLTKEQMEEELCNIGIEIPKMYKLGFSHNNCRWILLQGWSIALDKSARSNARKI